MKVALILTVIVWLSLLTPNAQAEQEVLRVCSQNLARYGEPLSNKNWKRSLNSKTELLERLSEAKCDIFVLQEIFGPSDRVARATGQQLAAELSAATGRKFSPLVGEGSNDQIRNGFLYDEQKAKLIGFQSYPQNNLRALSRLGRPIQFTRAPVGGTFQATSGRGRVVHLIGVHFKSKADGWKDPTGTNFEVKRMEMAEAIRLWVKETEQRLGEEAVILVAGDRNSSEGSATDEILSGTRTLEDFAANGRTGEPGPCRLDKELEPSCSPVPPRPAEMIGLLSAASDVLSAKGSPRLGSFQFRKRLELIDEILVEADEFSHFKSGTYVTAGVFGTFGKGSDHKLLWADLKW